MYACLFGNWRLSFMSLIFAGPINMQWFASARVRVDWTGAIAWLLELPVTAAGVQTALSRFGRCQTQQGVCPVGSA